VSWKCSFERARWQAFIPMSSRHPWFREKEWVWRTRMESANWVVLRHVPEDVWVDRITKATEMGGSEVVQVPDSSVKMSWLSFMTAAHVQPFVR